MTTQKSPESTTARPSGSAPTSCTKTKSSSQSNSKKSCKDFPAMFHVTQSTTVCPLLALEGLQLRWSRMAQRTVAVSSCKTWEMTRMSIQPGSTASLPCELTFFPMSHRVPVEHSISSWSAFPLSRDGCKDRMAFRATVATEARFLSVEVLDGAAHNLVPLEWV